MANGTIAFDTLSTSGQISGTAKSVDTDYVVSGSGKVWVNINQSSFSIDDSFNIASAVDESTGTITHNLSSSMVNSEYCVLGYYTPANNNSGSDNFANALTTSSYETRHYENGTQYDVAYRSSAVHGDLA
tara:strand:+ start:361 stop:750 length:390 start_codon:yes stop_codon:yes gene_type:complete